MSEETKLPATPAVASTDLLGHLRTDCLNALHCLYITTDVMVADEVNRMVKTYIAALETRITASCPNDQAHAQPR